MLKLQQGGRHPWGGIASASARTGIKGCIVDIQVKRFRNPGTGKMHQHGDEDVPQIQTFGETAAFLPPWNDEAPEKKVPNPILRENLTPP